MTDPPHRSTYNAGRVLQLLNHLPFVDERNVTVLKQMVTEPAMAQALIDLSAALIAQLRYRQCVDVDRILLQASEFFHQSVIARGYTFEPMPGELQAAARGQRVDILVAGAQARPIFQSRVDACIRILRDLHPETPTVTFSGSNPQRPSGAQQLDEAAEMIGYFALRKRVDHDFPSAVAYKIVRESQATNTIGNAVNFFKANPLAAGETAHLIVVSSLFHLPRFIDEIEKLKDDQALNLTQLTFVSPEEGVTEIADFMRDARYVKSCMFELFHAVVRDHPIDRLLRPSSYLG